MPQRSPVTPQHLNYRVIPLKDLAKLLCNDCVAVVCHSGDPEKFCEKGEKK